MPVIFRHIGKFTQKKSSTTGCGLQLSSPCHIWSDVFVLVTVQLTYLGRSELRQDTWHCVEQQLKKKNSKIRYPQSYNTRLGPSENYLILRLKKHVCRRIPLKTLSE